MQNLSYQKAVALLSFLIFATLWNGCGPKQVRDNRPVFEVARPIVTDTFYFREFVANINAISYVEVRSRVKGYVEKIHVDEFIRDISPFEGLDRIRSELPLSWRT